MKAVILDLESLDDLDLSVLKNEFSAVDVYMATTAVQVEQRITGAEVVITNKVPVNAAVMAVSPALKLICVVATGTNNIDLDAARIRGIAVSNCVAYGVDSVVQHVWSMILALHTNVLNYDRAVKNGDWGEATQFCMLPFPIRELSGRTLGILGYGNLGQGVASVAAAFGMTVILGEQPGAVVREGRVSFADLLAQSDVLSLHCPLTEATADLLNRDSLAQMKPGSMLINCARGGIVNEPALLAALASGQLAGAATDVLTQEPPRDGNPLISARPDNLIITPHSAWATREARERIIAQTVETVQGFKRGEAIRSVL